MTNLKEKVFKKEDFKKLDLLNWKKFMRVYKAIHVPSGKLCILKDVRANTIQELLEYEDEAYTFLNFPKHPNILDFSGCFVFETVNDCYKLEMVCEFGDITLESVMADRRKEFKYWKEDEFQTAMSSLISTFSFIEKNNLPCQNIRPSRLFLLPTCQLKIIDYLTSSYQFKFSQRIVIPLSTQRDDPSTYSYLSPIQWQQWSRTTVGDFWPPQPGHYKNQVFSVGLILYEMASLEDIRHFNDKNNGYDGEKMIEQGIENLKSRYTKPLCEIIKLMLRFKEIERPSFAELEELMLSMVTNNINERTLKFENNTDQDSVATLKESKEGLRKEIKNINLKEETKELQIIDNQHFDIELKQLSEPITDQEASAFIKNQEKESNSKSNLTQRECQTLKGTK